MTRKEFIFTEKFPQRSYRHIVFWLTFYLFSLITYFHDGLDKTSFAKWVLLEVSEVFTSMLFQMVFCYTILYMLLPILLNRKKYFFFITGIILLSVTTILLMYYTEIIIFKQIHLSAGLPFRPPAVFFWFSLIAFFSYFPVSAGLVIAIKTLKNFYVKQNENMLLTRENANAELQLLKAQVHPHFLFNTLNNIYSFTLNKSMQAPKLVMNLSDTLRYMINDCKADMVLLASELKMINDYIDLEKVRYGSRLNMKIEITGDTSRKSITPLLMIPFIENSFKHGASKMLREPWVHLFIQADENVLHFALANGKPAKENAKNKGGIGLSNVKKRLELLYPSNYLLTIESTEHTYAVNMQVPLQTQLKQMPVKAGNP